MNQNRADFPMPWRRAGVGALRTVARFWLLAMSLGIAPAGVAAGYTLYVDQRVDVSGDGYSWARPFKTLGGALNHNWVALASADRPVEIWIAQGTYIPPGGKRQATFNIRSSHVTLRGGFAGTESSPQERTPGHTTVLSGDQGAKYAGSITHANFPLDPASWDQLVYDRDDPGLKDNCYNVLFIDRAADVVLDSLVITGGNANNYDDAGRQRQSPAALDSMDIPSPSPNNDGPMAPAWASANGGGLYLNNVSTNVLVDTTGILPDEALTRYTFDTNRVSLLITNCVFINNTAAANGGGAGGVGGQSGVGGLAVCE